MANEALQLGFIAVFEDLKKYKGTGNLGGWIRTIVVRKCIDLLRERKSLRYDEVEDLEDPNPTLADIGDDYGHYEYTELLGLLDKLPLGYKTVFSMYVLDEHSHSEIAEALKISVATSRSQLYKARKLLISLVQKKYYKSSLQKS